MTPRRALAFTRPRGPDCGRGDRPPAGLLRHLILALALTFAPALLTAVELAPGLAYLRPGVDLAPQSGSAVLDLRAPMDDAALVPLLAAIAPGSNNGQRIILVLMSPDTPQGVRKHIAALPRCITIGRSEPTLKTDITVTTTADADERAIRALVAGIAPEKLLVENTGKRRYDESSLVREHNGISDPSTPAAVPDASAPASPAGPAASSPAEPAPVDAVLQRALHLYRGLVVLKKA